METEKCLVNMDVIVHLAEIVHCAILLLLLLYIISLVTAFIFHRK